MHYVKLGEICDIETGSTPKTSVKEYWGGENYWITPSDMNLNSGIIFKTSRLITDVAVKNNNMNVLPVGTVLFSSRAPIGKVGIAGTEMYCNQGFKNFICSESLYNKYLYYFLIYKREAISELGRGATFKEVSKKIVSNITIPLPNLKIQHSIADIFEKLDDLTSLKTQELYEVDNLIKSRFNEMFGQIDNIVDIGEVVSISRGASPRPINKYITTEEGVNWIKIGDTNENSIYVENTKEKITVEGALKSREVKKGDFILSNSMSFGRPFILKINGCVHDGWLILSDFKDTFDELFLYYSLKHDFVYSQFKKKVNGATVKNLNSDLVKNTKIQLPPLSLQNEFADFVKQVDKSKLEIKKSLEELETLKKSLMQKYFG